ncbi:hypothetical protein GOV12_08070 [Candidatus Pacearchaeota archaeon]|nr:hypothetical protein [Candidatus Pacearchaeota archaeon]
MTKKQEHGVMTRRHALTQLVNLSVFSGGAYSVGRYLESQNNKKYGDFEKQVERYHELGEKIEESRTELALIPSELGYEGDRSKIDKLRRTRDEIYERIDLASKERQDLEKIKGVESSLRSTILKDKSIVGIVCLGLCNGLRMFIKRKNKVEAQKDEYQEGRNNGLEQGSVAELDEAEDEPAEVA